MVAAAAAVEGFWVKKNSSHKSWLIYAALVVQNMFWQNLQQEIHCSEFLRVQCSLISNNSLSLNLNHSSCLYGLRPTYRCNSHLRAQSVIISIATFVNHLYPMLCHKI